MRLKVIGDLLQIIEANDLEVKQLYAEATAEVPNFVAAAVQLSAKHILNRKLQVLQRSESRSKIDSPTNSATDNIRMFFVA